LRKAMLVVSVALFAVATLASLYLALIVVIDRPGASYRGYRSTAVCLGRRSAQLGRRALAAGPSGHSDTHLVRP